jgi:4-hydroxybenzoate polyprenyltransferase
VAAVLTGQLSIGWSNDLVDAPRDRAVGRTDKPLATGALDERLVRVACVVAVLATVPLSLLCGVVAGLVHLATVSPCVLTWTSALAFTESGTEALWQLATATKKSAAAPRRARKLPPIMEGSSRARCGSGAR